MHTALYIDELKRNETVRASLVSCELPFLVAKGKRAGCGAIKKGSRYGNVLPGKEMT